MLKIFLSTFVLISFGLGKNSQLSATTFNLELYNMTWIKHSDNFLKQGGGNITKLATNHYSVNVWFEFEHDWARNSELRIMIRVKPQKSTKILTFFDAKWNVCDALRTFKAAPMVDYIYTELKRKSNFLRSCPIKGNKFYWVRDFIITSDAFPSYTPYLSFNYSAMYYENKKLCVEHMVQGAIVPKN
ncbi:uncharacterized protein LOC131804004 [Musca domestica]|uniref:Uncharacterized protein LOC131804004 n=1 Tax=Musca domestica TaxID=7370 RepID=A0ABM3V8S3_MUSDO|nr:uncharacterized protein LOC131804004 [Musca domestica]